MEAKIKILSQYVAPFFGGVFLAAASMAPTSVAVVALVLSAGVCAYASFPVGDRLMRRLAGVPS